MGKVPSLTEAQELLGRYNEEAFHLRHAAIVSGVLGYFAQEYDPERVDFWRVAGLLHDLDFERYPEEHCIRGRQIMEEEGIDEALIHAAMSHGWPKAPEEPELLMEKVLYATEELTGLIGAVAIMRPSKSVSDLELKSVKKKFKTPAFAAGCSREVIAKGAEMLRWTLDALIERTILAMHSLMGTMEI